MTTFDLGEEADDADTEASEPADDDEATTAEAEVESAPAADEPAESNPSTVAEPDVEPRSTPAFEFDETDQHQIYVRGETWSGWEKARDGQVKPALVMDDIEDVRKSELQDAVLRLVADHADELPEYVKDARGIDD